MPDVLRFVALTTLTLTGCYKSITPIDPADAGPDALPASDAGCGPDAGADCVTVQAPRLIAPLSTATVTSRRPTLRWALPAGADGARVEICRDRGCASVVANFEATGSAGAPAQDLPPGVLFWRLRGRAGAATGSAFSRTWEFTVGARSAAFDGSYGTRLDLNGDGYGDVAVGAPDVGEFAGRVHVYLGSPAGLGASPSASIDSPDGRMTRFGQVLASAGDVNGDGYADLLVSATMFQMGTGRVYLYPGGPAGVGTLSQILFSPDGPQGNFGSSVASAGDVNGDGYADVIVGAYVANGVGRVHVYSGSAAGLSTTPLVTLEGPDGIDGYFGGAVAGAGDVNGDGYADVAVAASGADGNTGRVHVYLGSAMGPSATPAVTLEGPDGPRGAFGFSLASAGDVNGDGYPDLLVAAYFAQDLTGRVYVYLGGAAGLGAAPAMAYTGPDGPGSYFGTAVAGVGDVNGDGFGDLVVTGRAAPREFGRARVFLGGAAGPGATAAAVFDSPDLTVTHWGMFPAGATDVDGDGFADVVIGAPSVDDGAGRVYVFRGAGAGPNTLPATTLTGPDGAGGRFGIWVARGRSRASRGFAIPAPRPHSAG